jgi:hypothetical protein
MHGLDRYIPIFIAPQRKQTLLAGRRWLCEYVIEKVVPMDPMQNTGSSLAKERGSIRYLTSIMTVALGSSLTTDIQRVPTRFIPPGPTHNMIRDLP